MKKLFTLTAVLAIGLSLFAQQTTRTFDWDATTREYIEYVPTSYDGSSPAPVVFCLHGLGDNMTNFAGLGFHQIADYYGWIVITPQALMASIPLVGDLGTAWNSGAGAEGTPLGTIILNEDVDDSGFLIAVLDSLETYFNINTDSIFFTGFSMGGFMSNRMAAEHSDRITAVASVSGTIGKFFTPAPTENVNCLHFHGTADTQITYENAGFDVGGTLYPVGMGAEECVEYWRNYNNADLTAIETYFPDTKADGKTFERYLYLNGDNDSYTAFIKVIGGDHEWYYEPQNDIDYTTEIYKFFTNTMDFPTAISSNDLAEGVSLYPNPAKDFVTISVNNPENASLEIFNILGSKVASIGLTNRSNTVDISNIPTGMYIFRVYSNSNTFEQKMMIQR